MSTLNFKRTATRNCPFLALGVYVFIARHSTSRAGTMPFRRDCFSDLVLHVFVSRRGLGRCTARRTCQVPCCTARWTRARSGPGVLSPCPAGSTTGRYPRPRQLKIVTMLEYVCWNHYQPSVLGFKGKNTMAYAVVMPSHRIFQ